jgi:tetratricopeptide (TPR) repeat protein
MKTIDFSYFIERYNAGEMNEAERAWFEKELISNPDLRNEVELRRHTDKILENQTIIQLRNKLALIESSRSVPDPVSHPSKRLTMKYAAIIAGLILIGSLVILSRKPLSGDEVLAKVYTPYEVTESSRSIQAASNSDYTKAIEYYNVHDYRNAAMYFSKVIENDPRNMELTMLYGVSNFEESNYPEAERSFKKVSENDNSLYVEDAEWYLALCYLKTDEKAKAVDQFTSIKNSGGIYRKNARKILRRIK